MLLERSLRPQEDPVGLCQLLKWPDEKPNSRKVNRLFEVEAAARLECSKGTKCGEHTLGERGKSKGKWRETEIVRSVLLKRRGRFGSLRPAVSFQRKKGVPLTSEIES